MHKELVFRLSPEETNLILEGLGNLPFARVYGLVEKVQRQAREQLNGEPELATAPAITHTSGGQNGVVNGQ